MAPGPGSRAAVIAGARARGQRPGRRLSPPLDPRTSRDENPGPRGIQTSSFRVVGFLRFKETLISVACWAIVEGVRVGVVTLWENKALVS